MTKAFLPLLKNNLRLMFGLSKDFKQRRKDITIYVALGILILPVLVIGCLVFYYLAQNMPIENLTNIISSVMFASEFMVLFFGVQSAISILFFAKDNELLMSLPVTGLDIFLSKLTTIYLLHLGLALLLQLPIILTIGIGAAIKNAGFYILGVLGSFLTPFIPLLAITIIAVPLNYIISYFKRNNIIGTIAVLLIFAGVFGGYYYLIFAVQKSAQTGTLDMAQLQSAIKVMSYIIYPNTYLANSMITTGLTALKNFAIFFAIIFGLATLAIALSALLYRGSARRSLESGAKSNGKVKDNEVKSVTQSLLMRDIKNSLGETSSAINYLLGFIIPPIVMVMLGLIYGGDNQLGGAGPLNIVAVSLAFIFGCGMNYFAIVAFSREGRQMDILKMLPVSSKTIINQKIMLANVYTFIIDLILLVSMFIAKVHYMIVIMIFLCVLLAGIGCNIYVLYSDLKAPNFVWNTNKELFKNNSKTLSSFVIVMPLVLVGIASIMCFNVIWPTILGDDLVLNYFLTMLPSFAVSLLYAVCGLAIIYPKLEKMYENLEI